MIKFKIGIFIFDDVEVLDFAGPYEVFSSIKTQKNKLSKISLFKSPVELFTVSEKNKLIIAAGGLKVQSDYTFFNTPKPNILLIPGGIGTRKLLCNNNVLNWIMSHKEIDLLCSVCTGSLLLAKAGLLKNKKVTTHKGAFSLLKKISPSSIIHKKDRFVKDKYFTSAGVAAGIDMSFKIVEDFFGKVVSDNIAQYMEYKIRKDQ